MLPNHEEVQFEVESKEVCVRDLRREILGVYSHKKRNRAQPRKGEDYSEHAIANFNHQCEEAV